MRPEILIFGGNKGVRDFVRDGGDWHKHALFAGIFRNQGTIGRMDTRHDLGLIVFKLCVVRQILTKMPKDRHNTGATRDSHQKQKAEDNH